jgi:hypothetical protein
MDTQVKTQPVTKEYILQGGRFRNVKAFHLGILFVNESHRLLEGRSAGLHVQFDFDSVLTKSSGYNVDKIDDEGLHIYGYPFGFTVEVKVLFKDCIRVPTG